MRKFVFFFLTLILTSCSANINFSRQNITYKPYKKVNIIFEKQLDFHPTKLISTVNNIFVISSKNYLYFYKNDELINKLGGIGFSNNNFSQISDFAITSTQNIAVLDGLQRVMKIFDLNGNWLTDIKLNNFLHPALFDITQSDVFYIYDKDRDEITVSSHPSEQSDFTFGKFEMNNPTRLSISDNYLVLNNADGSSDIFELSGQLLEHKNSDIQVNRFGRYTQKKNFIFQDGVTKPIFLSSDTISFFNINGNYLTVVAGNKATVLKLYYE